MLRGWGLSQRPHCPGLPCPCFRGTSTLCLSLHLWSTHSQEAQLVFLDFPRQGGRGEEGGRGLEEPLG